MTEQQHEAPPPPPREAARPKRRDAAFHVAGVVLLGAALGGALALSSSRRHAQAQEGDARREELERGPRVEVGRVTSAPAGRAITVSGEVRPYRQVTLYAKVSGYLKTVKVDKGERVRDGEILGVIESPETEQEVASRRADLALKRLTEARLTALAPSGVVSQQERDTAAGQAAVAAAELSRVSALRGYQLIRAPFAGVITARYADPGALLQAATSSQGALPLVDVADINRLRVFVHLAQQEALFVREGDAVSMWTDERPDQTTQARVTRFTRELDPRTRTMLTEIEVDNRSGALYPGAFVRVKLSLATPPSLALPSEALMFRDDKAMAATVRDGRAVFVPIVIGDPGDKTVRLVSGLSEGDVVVLHPGDDVIDGGRVQVAAPPAKP